MTSISMDRNSDAIDPSRFLHGMRRSSIYDSADRRFRAAEREDDSGSCSSTSIGRNSDLSSGNSSAGEEEDSGEAEVQSSYKGPLDTMDALEDVLPVRKGISKFYNGKSKSFTSLADACTASTVKDLAKPDNPYTKKRKNLLVQSMLWEKNLNYPMRNNVNGMPKKLTNCSRSSAALGMIMSNSESNNNSDDSNSISSSPSCCRPPLHPQGKRTPCIESSSPDSPPPLRSSPWRSFSLSDLQSIASATSNNEDELH